MNFSQNLKLCGPAVSIGIIVGTLINGSFETGLMVYNHVTHEQQIHNVSDPDDRAFADDVREHVAIRDWVPDSILIQLRDFPCDVWNRYPNISWEKMSSDMDAIIGTGPAFPYIAHKEVQASCPQYLDKFPVDFDYTKG